MAYCTCTKPFCEKRGRPTREPISSSTTPWVSGTTSSSYYALPAGNRDRLSIVDIL
jgi:hypothetical protein